MALDASIANLGTVGQSLSTKLGQFNEERTNFKANIDGKIQEIQGIIGQINDKINLLEGHLQEVIRLKKEVQSLNEQISPLREKIEELNRQLEINKVQINQLIKDKEIINNQKLTLQRQNEILQSDNGRIANELSTMNQQLNTKNDEIIAFQNQNAAIEQKIQEHTRIITENEQQKNAMNEYIAKKAQEINTIADMLKAQIADIGSVASPDAELTGALEGLKTQLDGILGKLNTYDSSPLSESTQGAPIEPKSIQLPKTTIIDIFSPSGNIQKQNSIFSLIENDNKTYYKGNLITLNEIKNLSQGEPVELMRILNGLSDDIKTKILKIVIERVLGGKPKSKKRKTMKKRKQRKRSKLRGGWTYKGSPSLDSKSSVVTESSKTKSSKTKSSKSKSNKSKSNKKHKSKKVIRRYKR
jgi:uncharacterized coiled-coil DUF342 family protein